MGKRPYRALLIGVGAMGEAWCRACLPPNLADGLVAAGHWPLREPVSPSP